MTNNKKVIFGNSVILIIFLLDRFIKLFCRAMPDFLFFKNHYIAFGLPFPENILIILITVILFLLFIFLVKSYQKRDIFLILSLTFIILGAVSNLIDRLFYVYVIDYINIPFFTVFNLADTMIVMGIIMLIYEFMRMPRMVLK